MIIFSIYSSKRLTALQGIYKQCCVYMSVRLAMLKSYEKGLKRYYCCGTHDHDHNYYTTTTTHIHLCNIIIVKSVTGTEKKKSVHRAHTYTHTQYTSHRTQGILYSYYSHVAKMLNVCWKETCFTTLHSPFEKNVLCVCMCVCVCSRLADCTRNVRNVD